MRNAINLISLRIIKVRLEYFHDFSYAKEFVGEFEYQRKQCRGLVGYIFSYLGIFTVSPEPATSLRAYKKIVRNELRERSEARLSRSRKREITQLNFLVVFRARLPLSPPSPSTLVHGHRSSSRFLAIHRENFVEMKTSAHEKSIVRVRRLSLSLVVEKFRKVSRPIVNRAIFRLKVTRRAGNRDDC